MQVICIKKKGQRKGFFGLRRCPRLHFGMKLNEKNIFLFDGVGAFLSAIFTGLLLPQFSEFLGISAEVLRLLALLPLGYTLYSLSIYRFVFHIKPWMLLLIISANLAYCLVSASVILMVDKMTSWGIGLLLAEILVVMMVVGVEWQVYRKAFRS